MCVKSAVCRNISTPWTRTSAHRGHGRCSRRNRLTVSNGLSLPAAHLFQCTVRWFTLSILLAVGGSFRFLVLSLCYIPDSCSSLSAVSHAVSLLCHMPCHCSVTCRLIVVSDAVSHAVSLLYHMPCHYCVTRRVIAVTLCHAVSLLCHIMSHTVSLLCHTPFHCYITRRFIAISHAVSLLCQCYGTRRVIVVSHSVTYSVIAMSLVMSLVCHQLCSTAVTHSFYFFHTYMIAFLPLCINKTICHPAKHIVINCPIPHKGRCLGLLNTSQNVTLRVGHT